MRALSAARARSRTWGALALGCALARVLPAAFAWNALTAIRSSV